MEGIDSARFSPPLHQLCSLQRLVLLRGAWIKTASNVFFLFNLHRESWSESVNSIDQLQSLKSQSLSTCFTHHIYSRVFKQLRKRISYYRFCNQIQDMAKTKQRTTHRIFYRLLLKFDSYLSLIYVPQR